MTFDVALAVLLLAATSSPAAAPGQGASTTFRSEEALRYYVQGRLMEERGDYKEALGDYYRALLLDQSAASVARRISELSARVGDADRALEFAERSLRLEPHDARGLWLKGTALFSLGRTAEALDLLVEAAATDSNEIEYQRSLARVADRLDRLDLVVRACRRAVTLDEDDGEAWFQLAAAQARLGAFENAEGSLKQAVELNPLRPGNQFLQGLVQEGLGNDSLAIGFYRSHLEIHDNDRVTRRRLVNLLAREKRYGEALPEARKLVEQDPEDDLAAEVEIDLAFHAKRSSEAEHLLDAYRKRVGDDPDRLAMAVGVLARNDRKTEAIRLADRWQEGHPGDVRGLVLAARARALCGQPDEAITRCRSAIQAAPDSLEPRALLARILQDDHRYREAAAAWQDVLERFPYDAGVALELAFCREQLGDLAGAQQTVRDALQHEPDNATVLNFLGYLLADHNQDLDEAAALIRRALDQQPSNGAFVDSMGWVYYRLGRLAEARRELERAVRLTGGDPIVHEHLGDVYRDLRLMELAREEYRKSLAGDQSNQRVRAKLEEIR